MHHLMQHQINALSLMDYNDTLGLFISPGGGKTAIALTWLRDHFRDGIIDDALVICPASLVDMWYASIDGMIEFEGWTAEDVATLQEKVRVRSFQKTYQRVSKTVNHRDGESSKATMYRLRDDVDKKWGAVIIDESHSIGAHNSVQTRVALKIAQLTKYRYIMTGTPVSGSTKASKEDFSKLYGQFNFLTAGALWKNWSAFCKVAVVSFDRFYKPVRYNEKYCRDIMKQFAIAARLEDFADMPGFIENSVPCKLEAKKIYKDIQSHLLDDYDLNETVSGASFIRLLQICSGSLKTESETMAFGTSKDDVLADILKGTDDKVVIFCNFRASVDRCADVVKKSGKSAVIYDGRADKSDWKKFTAGDKDVIICQYQSGGAGLNLQVSHTMVFFEPTLSALLLDQARCRTYRKGQSEKCLYYFLYTPATVEARVWKAVREGVEVTNANLAEWAKEYLVT